MKRTSRLIALAIAGVIAAVFSTASIAAEPDTQAVEYYHPELKHYFITASAGEARFVDSGGAGAGWVRTGNSFGAWSSPGVAPADAALVYRFYSFGANSHVFISDEGERRFLMELEAKERAAIAGTGKSFQGWGLEGPVFLAMLPKSGQCPAATQAITRVYNDGYSTGEGSNHRYVSDDAIKGRMEDRAWKAEGIVLCAPLASTASVRVPPTAAPSGSFTGNATFKYEEVGKPEVKSRAALAIAIAADGAITGSGAGCGLSGSVRVSNATGTLRSGTLTATGCSDTRFNGVYSRVEIEQFAARAIDVRFKQGDNAKEASIEGVLNSATATTTPTPTPVPANTATIAGNFTGIFSVLVTERLSGQAERAVLSVNQPASVNVTTAGAVSGNVQGCAVSGSVTPGVDNRFVGTISLVGCSDARLNGSYAAGVHLEDGGAIEVELEREVEAGGVRTKVNINGDLARIVTGITVNPNPTPTSSGIAIAGSFSGSASFSATRRPAGGNEVTEVNKSQALSLTVSSIGTVSGSGGGCNFSGALALTNAALGIYSGTATASGCTDAIVNGNYTVTATRQTASSVEFELERESEINGERVKVKIKGTLNK